MLKEKPKESTSNANSEETSLKETAKDDTAPKVNQKASESVKAELPKPNKPASEPKISGFEKAAKEGVPKNIVLGQNLLG